MANLNQMNKEELDEYDGILNHPANEWLVFFWVMGVVDLPPELKGKQGFKLDSGNHSTRLVCLMFNLDNSVLFKLQSEMQNPDRVNMAQKMFDEYDRLGMDFTYQSAIKTSPL